MMMVMVGKTCQRPQRLEEQMLEEELGEQGDSGEGGGRRPAAGVGQDYFDYGDGNDIDSDDRGNAIDFGYSFKKKLTNGGQWV